MNKIALIVVAFVTSSNAVNTTDDRCTIICAISKPQNTKIDRIEYMRLFHDCMDIEERLTVVNPDISNDDILNEFCNHLKTIGTPTASRVRHNLTKSASNIKRGHYE